MNVLFHLPLGYDYIQFKKNFDTFLEQQTNLKHMFGRVLYL